VIELKKRVGMLVVFLVVLTASTIWLPLGQEGVNIHAEPAKILLPSVYEAKDSTGIDVLYDTYGLSGDGVTVAIIDWGVDTSHNTLNDDQVKVFVDFDDVFPDYETWGTVPDANMDSSGHGTFMANVIAGSGDNSGWGKPDRGVAFNADLICLKATTDSARNAAFDWLIQHKNDYGGIDVVSISWGNIDRPDNWADDWCAKRVEELVSNGMVVCVAAGQRSSLNDDTNVATPGTAPHAITVGAVKDTGEVDDWTRWEGNPNSHNPPPNYLGQCYGEVSYSDLGYSWIKPDILAPGYNIKKPRIGTTTGWTEDPATCSGSSPATAFVAGLVALLLEYKPWLKNDSDGDGNPDVKQLLWSRGVEDTLKDETMSPSDYNDGVGSRNGFDDIYGAGRIDAPAIMNWLSEMAIWDTGSSRSSPYYISNPSYWSYGNSLMWENDVASKEDWFTFSVYSYSSISASIRVDPNLKVKVYLYKMYSLITYGYDYSSTYGDDCYVWGKDYAGTYYLRVVYYGSIRGDFCYGGDFYGVTVRVQPLGGGGGPPPID
jgi:hypothetical protein